MGFWGFELEIHMRPDVHIRFGKVDDIVDGAGAKEIAVDICGSKPFFGSWTLYLDFGIGRSICVGWNFPRYFKFFRSPT